MKARINRVDNVISDGEEYFEIELVIKLKKDTYIKFLKAQKEKKIEIDLKGVV